MEPTRFKEPCIRQINHSLYSDPSKALINKCDDIKLMIPYLHPNKLLFSIEKKHLDVFTRSVLLIYQTIQELTITITEIT